MMYLTGPGWMRSWVRMGVVGRPLVYGILSDVDGHPVGGYEERPDGSFTWSLTSGVSGMEATEIEAQVMIKKTYPRLYIRS